MTDRADRTPLPQNAAAVPGPTAWSTFGKHRFRAPIGIVVDAPFPMAGGWMAIIWPDPTDPAGWRRLVWEADTDAGRGWLIPERLAYADVIEFGSDPTGAQRWYGVVESYEPGSWHTLHGPYATPADAHRAAETLLQPDRHVPQPRSERPVRRVRERCGHGQTRRR